MAFMHQHFAWLSHHLLLLIPSAATGNSPAQAQSHTDNRQAGAAGESFLARVLFIGPYPLPTATHDSTFAELSRFAQVRRG
jgi:hypothetical protein